ncbi:hypothetical protein RRG08_059925 [Elysia crispata]|uniref:Uncharacterized protein n=1 Tax=Elysia crispata TaxID=231223 RepID=A0AAE0Y7J9_9GAST|nr:hypothetical protein RRG08_059925 [Elysia crispata]
MKFKTVCEGEQAVILNHRGEGRLVVGPHRVFLFRERFNRLKSKTADRYQYLEIQANNGSISHRPGPCLEFNNPLKYQGCVKQEAHCIDGNHILVVYRRLKGARRNAALSRVQQFSYLKQKNGLMSFNGTALIHKTKHGWCQGSTSFSSYPLFPTIFTTM